MADKNVGERIRMAREKADLSQVELAKRVKVTRTAIYHWEEGVTEIRNGTVPALAAALGVHPSTFTPFGSDPDRQALARIEEKIARLLGGIERIERRLNNG
jgi:transcriptional regulator with XRE-family HTH domain